MLDEIYLRLLHELTPNPAKTGELRDLERVVKNYDKTRQARRSYGQLIDAVYKYDPDSDIGLRYGQLLKTHTICDFTQALMTSKNFAEVLELINSLQYMQGTNFYLTTHESTRGDASLSINYPFQMTTTNSQKLFFAETVFSYVTNLLHHCTGIKVSPKKIHLDVAPPKYADQYKQIFQCNIEYNQPLATLVFENDVLNLPFSSHNEVLHGVFLKKCLDRVRIQEKTWQFSHRTSVQMMRNSPRFFNAGELANSMGLSVRGLQKKLNKCNTSFSQLATNARLALLKVALLQKHLALKETAELLGFQTVSGLRRFFKTEAGECGECLSVAFEQSSISALETV